VLLRTADRGFLRARVEEALKVELTRERGAAARIVRLPDTDTDTDTDTDDPIAPAISPAKSWEGRWPVTPGKARRGRQ